LEQVAGTAFQRIPGIRAYRRYDRTNGALGRKTHEEWSNAEGVFRPQPTSAVSMISQARAGPAAKIKDKGTAADELEVGMACADTYGLKTNVISPIAPYQNKWAMDAVRHDRHSIGAGHVQLQWSSPTASFNKLLYRPASRHKSLEVQVAGVMITTVLARGGVPTANLTRIDRCDDAPERAALALFHNIRRSEQIKKPSLLLLYVTEGSSTIRSPSPDPLGFLSCHRLRETANGNGGQCGQPRPKGGFDRLNV
jgi:hypothetical protein